ncbi:MAG: aldehyde dehydrogenase [Acidimicrobiia bacterium]|nr:aldehyde dehydrogenase [Acidimicrobiia bacterium]
MLVKDRLYIGGDWVAPASADVIEVVSPSTEEVIGRVPEGQAADVDRAVAAARQAFDHGPWPRLAPEERAGVLASVSASLQDRSEELAALITAENGSPISWSIMGQVFASTMVADYYVGLAKEYEFTERRSGLFGSALVRKLPVGVAAAIAPWNVPLFVTMLKLAPAMVAGCAVVVKPAPETPLDAYVLAECLESAGLPPGVVSIVPAGREVGEHLVTHPDVDKVAFTGSTAAGRRIASLCGERLRRVTLELGGKSASIILDDADLDDVVAGLMPAAVMNNGQACVAQSRILASRDRYGEVVDRLSEAVGALTVGDPADPATEVGPLVAERQRTRVEGYLASGREEGARVTVGGGRPAGLDRGWYVEPTVFADVDNAMRIAQEEIFGPVLAVIAYDDVDQAVAIANDSPYGLSGSVYGADVEEATEVAGRVRTGTSTVNGFMLEFGCPFGGFKSSGLGRELGPEGLEAYLELQSISLPAGDSAGVPAGA